MYPISNILTIFMNILNISFKNIDRTGFNKIYIFPFLVCAFHKGPIELYNYAHCNLKFLISFYSFKPSK